MVERVGTIDNPPQSCYSLFVLRESRWHLVQYFAAAQHESLPEIIRQYLNTIHWPDARHRLDAASTPW